MSNMAFFNPDGLLTIQSTIKKVVKISMRSNWSIKKFEESSDMHLQADQYIA